MEASLKTALPHDSVTRVRLVRRGDNELLLRRRGRGWGGRLALFWTTLRRGLLLEPVVLGRQINHLFPIFVGRGEVGDNLLLGRTLVTRITNTIAVGIGLIVVGDIGAVVALIAPAILIRIRVVVIPREWRNACPIIIVILHAIKREEVLGANVHLIRQTIVVPIARELFAGVPELVAVHVGLVRVPVLRAIVAEVADAITIGVGLVPVGQVRAVVPPVEPAVVVGVGAGQRLHLVDGHLR